MRLFATVLITLIITAFVALFVWAWYTQNRIIPEVVFGGLLTLVASLVSFMWLRSPKEAREERKYEERKRPPNEWF
jgi:uncharacterized membrane protein